MAVVKSWKVGSFTVMCVNDGSSRLIAEDGTVLGVFGSDPAGDRAAQDAQDRLRTGR